MVYIYPKFSGTDLLFCRLGGAGMGNLLFTYVDAFLLSQKYNMPLIWPTWRSIKVGPWLRHEKDKRHYGGLYKPNNDQIHGLSKVMLFLTFHSVDIENDTLDENIISGLKRRSILRYYTESFNIENYLSLRNQIKKHLWSIVSLKVKKKIREVSDLHESIHIHVRLGDFKEMNDPSGECLLVRSPINWFISCVLQINKTFNGNMKFVVFSDGSDEELGGLLALPNVERVTTGSSIGDIFALSRTRLIIATGPSTFSLWARFLGNTSCLCYDRDPEHMVNSNGGFELGVGYEIDDELMNKIVSLYKKSYIG